MSAQVQRLWGLPVIITRITPPTDLHNELSVMNTAIQALKAEGHSMIFRVVDFSEAERSMADITNVIGCDDFLRDPTVRTLVVGPPAMARLPERSPFNQHLAAVYPSVGEALAAI